MATTLNGKIPFVMEIDGHMNGVAFRVEGKGFGNADEGALHGNWECTTGNIPLSWATLAATLGYGYKCFTKYPENVSNIFSQCFPEGYTQERITEYKSGGTITTFHEIKMKDGTIFNKVKFNGIGFPSTSPVITKNLAGILPSVEYTYPFENGIRSIVNHIFPYINGNGFEEVRQSTINKPIGSHKAVQPPYHHTHVHIKQSNVGEKSVTQEETLKAYLPGF